MSYLSEQEFNIQMEELKKRNESIERKRKLKEEKSKYKFQFKLPSPSKLVLLVVFLMCIEIMIFAQYASIILNDSSPLVTLIGIPVTLVPTVIAYMLKSKSENTQGGITYEKVMHELSIQNMYIDEDESVG